VRHFAPSEFRDDPARVAPALVHLLDDVREAAGVPVHVHCAWQDGGHSAGSRHYTGQAVDFHFGPGLTHLEEFALLAGFREIGGLGFYPEWRPRPGWHVDLRQSAPRLFWVRLDGRYDYGFRPLARTLGFLEVTA
jgi:uncharacterized protein YcbK (DUF882 family)